MKKGSSSEGSIKSKEEVKADKVAAKSKASVNGSGSNKTPGPEI
jgi:hypothetical protein